MCVSSGLIAGPSEGGRPRFGQQTGYERFHDGGGDLPVPHTRHRHNTLLARPGLLRSDWGRVSWTHTLTHSPPSEVDNSADVASRSSACLQFTRQSGLDEVPGCCKLEPRCSNGDFPRNRADLSRCCWDIDNVWGQILPVRPSDRGLNWLSAQLLNLMVLFDHLQVQTHKSITLLRIHKSHIGICSVVLLLRCVMCCLTGHVAFHFFDA